MKHSWVILIAFFTVCAAQAAESKPWEPSPASVAHGKEIFMQQCVACHGPKGQGNGPAAAALNPHPRNFTSDQGWVNGRKMTSIFKTLKEGISGSAMASFAAMPAADRWALAQYVLSLGPTKPVADTPADFAKIGINPNSSAPEAEKKAPEIPVALAMQKLEQPESPFHAHMEVTETGRGSTGESIYAARCLSCHGPQTEGHIAVESVGAWPKAFLITEPLSAHADVLHSPEAFKQVVLQGLPGNAMPGTGNLTADEMRSLYQYVQGIAR